MALERLKFNGYLNSSLQAGDTAYRANLVNGIVHGDPLPIGEVVGINNLGDSFSIIVNVGTVGSIPAGSFIMFSKPIKYNESGLKGYYADVTLENHSMERVELFAMSSEISPSSK